MSRRMALQTFLRCVLQIPDIVKNSLALEGFLEIERVRQSIESIYRKYSSDSSYDSDEMNFGSLNNSRSNVDEDVEVTIEGSLYDEDNYVDETDFEGNKVDDNDDMEEVCLKDSNES